MTAKHGNTAKISAYILIGTLLFQIYAAATFIRAQLYMFLPAVFGALALICISKKKHAIAAAVGVLSAMFSVLPVIVSLAGCFALAFLDRQAVPAEEFVNGELKQHGVSLRLIWNFLKFLNIDIVREINKYNFQIRSYFFLGAVVSVLWNICSVALAVLSAKTENDKNSRADIR